MHATFLQTCVKKANKLQKPPSPGSCRCTASMSSPPPVHIHVGAIITRHGGHALHRQLRKSKTATRLQCCNVDAHARKTSYECGPAAPSIIEGRNSEGNNIAWCLSKDSLHEIKLTGKADVLNIGLHPYKKMMHKAPLLELSFTASRDETKPHAPVQECQKPQHLDMASSQSSR